MLCLFPVRLTCPVLAVGPLIPCVALFALLICFPTGECRKGSPESPAPQLTDLRSQITGVEELLEEFRKQLQQQRHPEQPEKQRLRPLPVQGEEKEWSSEHRLTPTSASQRDAGEEDAMQQQLQEVGVRPGGEFGEDFCNFNQMEDYIIRTKDSLEAGATFLKVPAEVSSWKQCLEVCCAEARCSAAVVEQSGQDLSCFIFDCTLRGRSVCQFSPHRDYSSYTLTGRNASSGWALRSPLYLLTKQQENDEPPHSNAGQDVVLQLPVDWVILDGRESSDDHAIIRYDWTLLLGDPLVHMKNVILPAPLQFSRLSAHAQLSQNGKLLQLHMRRYAALFLKIKEEHKMALVNSNALNLHQGVPHPGTLKLSHLQEGVYTMQLTVTDTSGQKNSDNVSVSVLAEEPHGTECTGKCSRYQFICDDGCCIDITLACDRVIQCPDGSDEAFCQNFNSGRKTVIHISESTDKHTGTGVEQEIREYFPTENVRTAEKKMSLSLDMGKNYSLTQELRHNMLIQDKDGEGRENFLNLKDVPQGSGHPVPETGAVLPLALGLAITALLLLMVVCRLQLVKQKLKKARPLTSEESDYLINGMYL
ncbi:low-density lipoprotein receptor-related protein 11 isoform X1 [Xenopus laevis]|uniref:Low-density lipoprotein receptor-related protein 11 isoform X1 n=1 Tax=Xenopus laevis TaxID=8355 RepID=A0A8J0VC32_XENLA|nr:low-density lipoprotein receptor-related protein 11 isoform X1 [Xenopus laevis]